jgi:hypothetical protein
VLYRIMLARVCLISLFWLLLFVPSAPAAPVSCPKVISVINSEIRRTRGESPDLSTVAKRLRTPVVWIEHCMRVYGRRPRRPGSEGAEARESRLERFEDEEPEEVSREDLIDPDIGPERDRRPSRQRILRYQRTPTPKPFAEF